MVLPRAAMGLLQAGGLLATAQGKLLVAVVALAAVVLVGRIVLGIAWKLLRIAIVVIAVAWVISVVAPGLI